MAKKIKQIFFGKLEDFDKQKSIDYWQKQSAEARLKAAWQLVEDAWKLKGKEPSELRFNRNTAVFKRL